MPMKRELYPEDWEAISLRIRERDGWRCRWCGVPHGKTIVRSRIDGPVYAILKHTSDPYAGLTWPDGSDVSAVDETQFVGRKPIKIVLTVAHLGTPHDDGTPGDKHDKMDVRDENLAALCQRCHLAYDLDDHLSNARETRAKQKHTAATNAGQLGLFEEE